MSLLKIADLKIQYLQSDPNITAVNGISFELNAGEILGIVGESGAGKSQSLYAILGLLPETATYSGKILFQDENLATLSSKRLESIRGNTISMVFQDPMTSLNPYMDIKSQLIEGIIKHQKIHKAEALAKAIELLKEVDLSDSKRILNSYPHQLSGGMRQRVLIAMALMCEPDILLLDEPTTALDVTTQAQILKLLNKINRERGTSMIFITHDLGVVAELCDRVIVMQHGNIVETAPTQALIKTPKESYTQDLLAAIPKISADIQHPALDASAQKVFSCKNMYMRFLKEAPLFKPKEYFKALNAINVDILTGQCVGIVGESGSGKSTLARCMAGILSPSSGDVFYQNESVSELILNQSKAFFEDIQIIFQDPLACLNPRLTVGQSIAESLAHNKSLIVSQYQEAIAEQLLAVGLEPSMMNRYPHEFSGGQCQRICIARAMIAKPKVLICDEPVSALDVSIQAKVMDLIQKLVHNHHLTCIFISHDLSVVYQLCQYVIVLEKGKVVEQNSTQNLFEKPNHAYTQSLFAAIPKLDPSLGLRQLGEL